MTVTQNDVIVPLVTGDTVYFTVKVSASDTAKAFQKVVASFNTDGSATITIDPSDTKELNIGDYVYDVQITFETGDVKTVIPMSKFRLAAEVTNE